MVLVIKLASQQQAAGAKDCRDITDLQLQIMKPDCWGILRTMNTGVNSKGAQPEAHHSRSAGHHSKLK